MDRTDVIISVRDQEELQERIGALSNRLRNGLQSYALLGLSDMLNYNQGLMLEGIDCLPSGKSPDVSGAIAANEEIQTANLALKQTLNACEQDLKMMLDAGVTFTRFEGQSHSRGFAAMRFERELSQDNAIGIAVVGSRNSSSIMGFNESSISDVNGTVEIYGRASLLEDLKVAGFFGLGRTWYDFNLSEPDGLTLSGSFTGTRLLAGGTLGGEFDLANRPMSVDFVVSYASDDLGNLGFSASLNEQRVTDASMPLGRVGHTRVSLPIAYSIIGPTSPDQKGIGLTGTLGLLCEQRILTSGLSCGYSTGAHLSRRTFGGSASFIAVDFESAAGIDRLAFNVGHAFEIDTKEGLSLEFNFSSNHGSQQLDEYSGIVSLMVRR